MKSFINMGGAIKAAGTRHYPSPAIYSAKSFNRAAEAAINILLWLCELHRTRSLSPVNLSDCRRRCHLLSQTFCTVRCALFIGSEPLEWKPQAIITAICQAACPPIMEDYVSCHRKPNGRHKLSGHRFYLAFGSFPFPCIYYTTPIGKCQ